MGKTGIKKKATTEQQNGTIKKVQNAEKATKVNDEGKKALPKKRKQEDSDKENKLIKLEAPSINKAIFPIFNKFEKENCTQNVLQEMLKLINNDTDKGRREATCAYALKRMVRCTGSDNQESVSRYASFINVFVNELADFDAINLLNITKKELNVGNQQKGKEDTLAAVGQLIVALTIIKSQKFSKPTDELLSSIYPILISHLSGRDYIKTLCADILIDSFKQLDKKKFQLFVWPLLESQLTKRIGVQEVHICNVLLEVALRYPKLLPQQKLETILWAKKPQYEELFMLYLNAKNLNETIFERLGRFLASNDNLLTEWSQHIVGQLPVTRNGIKCYIIQTLGYVIMNYKDSELVDKPLEKLFAIEPLIKMILQECETAKRLTKATPKEPLKPMKVKLFNICSFFETAVLLCLQSKQTHETTKLNLLIGIATVQPELDNIVKTPRFTQLLFGELEDNGLQAMYKFYEDLFVSNDENQAKTTRLYALKQMQDLLLNEKLIQRKKKIDFLLLTSIFYMDNERNPCSADKAAAYSRQAAARCEEILISLLLNKINSSTEQLVAFRDQLHRTLKPLRNHMALPNVESKLRIKLTSELRDVWDNVEKSYVGSNGEKKNLSVVFDVITLFLSLAMLAPGCNLQPSLIKDMITCKKLALESSKTVKKQKKLDESDMSWQDVMTDALLQLMLQESSFCRSFVNAVSKALMPYFTKQNLDQMLDIYNMDRNPLGQEDDDDNNDDDEEEEDEEKESTDEDEESTEDENDSNEDNDDEDIDDKDNDDEDDEATNLEQIRESVRQALHNDENDDNDASSIDWNDVDEEQGERLNKALERAFVAFRPKRQNKAKRETKSERINATTLLHFRIRVLDLLEMFVTAQPQLQNVLDVLNTVYFVHEISIKDSKLNPLAEAIKKLLRKLLTIKLVYSEGADDIVETIKTFMEPKKQQQTDNPIAKQEGQIKAKAAEDNLRNKCIVYLINQFNDSNVTKTPLWPLLENYIHHWATHRNTEYSLASFEALFLSHWSGIGQLAISFSELLKKDVRFFRCVQILNLLAKHGRSICNTLANNADALKTFSANISEYKPAKPTDKAPHKKLLLILSKSPVIAKASD